jgi:hypothetical protein
MVPCGLPMRYATAFTPVNVGVTEVAMLLGIYAIGCGSHAIYTQLAHTFSQT